MNASFDVLTNKPTPGSYGYGFDLEAAKERLDKAEYGEEIRIPMEYIEPEIFGEGAFFRDVLGTYETRLDSNAARTTNLELACEALNGLELNPNEEFSFNRTLGEPTSAKGYKKALPIPALTPKTSWAAASPRQPPPCTTAFWKRTWR